MIHEANALLKEPEDARLRERVRDFVITTWLGLVSDILMSAWTGRINLM